MDNAADAALDQEYNARLCSHESDPALAEVAALFRSKDFNSAEVVLSTTGAQIRPESGKSADEIHDVYAAPGLADDARQAYIATIRRIARGIDVDA